MTILTKTTYLILGILVVGLIVIGVLAVNKFYLKKAPVVKQPTSQEVAITKNKKLSENTVVFKQKSGFAQDKPVEGKDYKIEYDGGSTSYYVTINTDKLDTFRTIKKDAEKTIKNAGAVDICTLKIYFLVPPELKNQIDHADFFVSGCPPLF